MKTSTILLLTVCAAMIASSFSQNFTFIDNDANFTASNLYPANVTSGSNASQSINVTTANFTANVTTNTNTTVVLAKGIPINSTIVFTQNATTDNVTLVITTGGQPVTVVNGSNATIAANALGVFTFNSSTAVCGSNAVDGALGLLYVFFTGNSCNVTIVQQTVVVAAVTTSFTQAAFLANSTLQQAAIAGVAAAAGNISTSLVTITGTAASSTIIFFNIAAPSSGNLTSIASNLASALSANTLTISGATVSGGVASVATASSVHNNTSPLATETAAIAAAANSTSTSTTTAAAKSHTRMMVLVGVFSTAVATLFGLLV